MSEDTFSPFPRLPTELREEIWRYCLPHRVNEIDDPVDWAVFGSFGLEDKAPCTLKSTSISNGRPPLLTRVCHESRRIAFESGSIVSVPESPEEESPCQLHEDDWDAQTRMDRDHWQDSSRNSAHLHWTACYSAALYYSAEGNPLESLVRESKRLNGSASLMLLYINDAMRRYSKQRDLAALKLLPKWLVVTRVIVIHLDSAQAARTGLFGLLGDAPVQVVDAYSPLASQLYELAETCERGAYALTAAQNFDRMSADDMDAFSKLQVFRVFEDHDLFPILTPRDLQYNKISSKAPHTLLIPHPHYGLPSNRQPSAQHSTITPAFHGWTESTTSAAQWNLESSGLAVDTDGCVSGVAAFAP
ncbi:hypothetical protein E4T49_06544 [Aureobasidium sp. EXF-10728]|nr:hypothetical protein E4T49_06544 [Aureobasidium sp. EXF-10728]